LLKNLLGIDTEQFIESIITSCPIAGRNEFTRNYTLEVALDARDASAKFIYAKLFSWIISKINQTLSYKPIDSKTIKNIGNLFYLFIKQNQID
jgi:myosin-5